jgi:shikimate dehydrogenase
MSSAVKILALLGHQVDYSLSPFIHNTAISHLGLNYFYTIFNIATSEDLKDVLNGMRAMGIAGFNVTIPYKERVMAYMDKLSPAASEIQAVNTILNQDGHLIGYNTDSYGFAQPLLPYKNHLKGQAVAIFGNGGAARAAIHALRNQFDPSVIYIISRNQERGRELKKDLLRQSTLVELEVLQHEVPETIEVLKSCKCIINATPIGTQKRNNRSDNNQSLLVAEDINIWHTGDIAYDLVYNPFETPFLKQAGAKGAFTINGLGMLVAQASESFKLWTGHEMPLFNVEHAIKTRLDHNLIH